ncbi:nucleoside phosphorylase [Fusarium sp. NRRL 52700]|nr:nucleoside phosphorylase [Fusarium sp. NRRL 52700]
MASALTAAPLSPEIRLAQAVSEFVADLSDEQKRLFRTQQVESLPPKDTDVITAIAEIHEIAAPNQADNVRLYEPRMSNFLKAVQEFASIQNEKPDKFLSWQAGSVWLLVRLTFTRLALTPRWLDAVSELFMGSCRSSPYDMEIGSFDSHSEQLRWRLCEYYFVVVRICHYLFSLQPRLGYPETISLSTDAMLIRYKSDLEGFTALINEELVTLERQRHPTDPTYNDSHVREEIDSAKHELDPEKHAEYLQLLEIQLDHDYMASWQRIRKLGSTSLFTFEPRYQRFIDYSGSSTLLYSGSSGTGKSVILANMVDHLSQRHPKTAQIAFFFCRRDEDNSLQALVILGAIYHQVLKALGGLPAILDNKGDVVSNLQVALEAAGKTYLILDGLGQCPKTEQTKVIKALQSLQAKCSLSICLSSRPENMSYVGWTDPHSIDIPVHNRDVSSYIESEISRRLENGELVVAYPDQEFWIISALTTAAKGNFVWARRNIELLCEQSRYSDIHELLVDFEEDSNGVDTEAMQHVSPAFPAPIAPSGFADSAYASASWVESNSKNTNDGRAVDYSLLGLDHPAIEDSVTEYSDIPSTTFSRKRLYIRELATDLYDRVGSVAIDAIRNHQVDISASLQGLLKAFALKIGYRATTQMHRDVMAFVHRHRSDIAAVFLDICFGQWEMEPKETIDQPGAMSLNEQVALWEQNEDMERSSIDEDLDSSESAESEEVNVHEDADVWIAAYRDFAPNTEAYSWLLTQLRRDIDCILQERPAMLLIRDKILSSVPQPQRVSRRIASDPCSVRFEIDWDVIGFFDSQEYSKPPCEALPGLITLTGGSSDAQASICAGFLKQTWPSTGDIVLQLICELLRLGEEDTSHTSLPDGTRLAAWISESKVMVQTDGSAASISETGEQLAWLGAALRSSPYPSGLSYCTPSIRSIHRDAGMSQAVLCVINFELEQLPEPPDNANGHCWHGIFKNPIVVKGFPILSKLERNTGLEIPLEIMAGLARTDRVDQYNDKVYIKGFSTMLVPTKQFRDVVYWHLIYKEDGTRISYLDDNLDRDTLAGFPDLTAYRHVLGWCSEARFYSGSSQAEYHVRHSELPKPHPGCALAGTMITLGRMITGGHSFELGIKDTPVHVARNGYIPRLKWISSKFFLLWDESDKRGWLTNGTSALLHVVRASLAHDSIDKFQSAFLFKPEELEESMKPFTADSAIDVLINPKNLALKLYPEKDGFIVLRDRIDQYYNLLEKMLDHQTDVTRQHTGSLERMPRKHLAGWDFEDLSANRDPLYPRLVTLEPAGKGWVDLVRVLEAVTLTGRGFGELVRPVGSTLYMQHIIRDHRSYKDDFSRLSDDLIWHNALDISGQSQCGCIAGHHGEPIHVLFPSALSHRLCASRNPVSLKSCGAVVFGHNRGFSWVWGDDGLPTEQDLEEQLAVSELSDGNDKDSGVGASLMASSSDDHRSSKPSSSISSPPWPLRNLSRIGSTPSDEQKAFSRNQYTVGILCALPIELKAIRALFDQRHQNLARVVRDNNQYALGEMAQHMVVAACLPAGEYGTNAAASAVSDMMRSFVSIQFCLLVGIAGGAPSDDNDVRLGDVVVSLPTQTFPGVIQYDLGKENEGSEFEVTGVLQRPPRILTNAISKLRSDPDIGFDALNPHLTRITESLPTYKSPGPELDMLSRASCTRRTCKPDCTHLEQRLPRLTAEPMIHYGLVASGNRVVKDATLRDRLSRKYGVLCFEMEAAGVMNRADCLVIRGICDYSDAQKNKVWQNYAAAVAAAYTKLLLGAVAINDLACDNVRTDDEPVFKRRRVNTGNEGRE